MSANRYKLAGFMTQWGIPQPMGIKIADGAVNFLGGLGSGVLVASAAALPPLPVLCGAALVAFAYGQLKKGHFHVKPLAIAVGFACGVGGMSLWPTDKAPEAQWKPAGEQSRQLMSPSKAQPSPQLGL